MYAAVKRACREVLLKRIVPMLFPRDVVCRRHGIRLRLNLQDDIQFLLFCGRYESRDLAWTRRLVPSGGTCLDVGANIGVFALTMARAAGAAGRVFAFEPDPDVFARLQGNCAENPGLPVRPVQAAVSSAAGTATFYRSDVRHHSGWGTIEQFSDLSENAIRVPTTTLDEFCRAQDIPHMDLLKIDVEAHEFAVLEGARGLLSEGRVGHVLVEFNGFRLGAKGHRFADFLERFDELGYSPAPEFNRDVVERCRTDERFAATACANVLFAPRRVARARAA